MYYAGKMVFFDVQSAGLGAVLADRPLEIGLIAAFFTVHAVSYDVGRLSVRLGDLRGVRWATFAASALVVLYALAGGQQSFIYFKF
ncbi:MAG: hypothetical protein ACRD2X_09290 [Vicinamibacteraceae bacterium]